MKTQILPNHFKKLGLFIFIIASLLNGGFNFINNSANKYRSPEVNVTDTGKDIGNGILGLLNAFTGGGLVHSIDFLAIAAILIFMLSKEKVEDDYINKLRLESFQLTTLLSLLAAIVFYLIAKDITLTMDYFIFPLMWIYLSIFFIKKTLYL